MTAKNTIYSAGGNDSSKMYCKVISILVLRCFGYIYSYSRLQWSSSIKNAVAHPLLLIATLQTVLPF